MKLTLIIDDMQIETEIPGIVIHNSWMEPEDLAKFLTDVLFGRTWLGPVQERMAERIKEIRKTIGESE